MFALGLVHTTEEALRALKQAKVGPAELLTRHQNGDWGEVDEEGRLANEAGFHTGRWILSIYTLPTGVTLWVRTLPPTTVILLAGEG